MPSQPLGRDVVMPRLSDSMEEGTILRWLKREGEPVGHGEPLVEIETDKANMTYDADQEGVLEILAQEGDTLAIGEVIARLRAPQAGAGAASAGPGDPGRQPPASPPTSPSPTSPSPTGPPPLAPSPAAPSPVASPLAASTPVAPFSAAPASTAPPHRPEPSPGARPERVKASPLARRIARERGVALASLHGTGPGGRIVKVDVEAAAPSPPGPRSTDPGTAKGETRIQEPTRVQQVIARRMAESKATIPHFTLQAEIDMEACRSLRAQLRGLAGDGAIPTFNDMAVKACALALHEFPRANGAYRDGRFELYSRVNVGVAVATEDSLVVPTVFDANAKSLGEIAREARALAERVRSGAITPPELSGGTFTVSNLGMFGVSSFTAVINPPQSAILSLGEIAARAVVRDGDLAARYTMQATLACDHRILYGAEAARFLARVRELLEQPLALTL